MGNDRNPGWLKLQYFIPITHTDHRVGCDNELGERITSTGRWITLATFHQDNVSTHDWALLLVSLGNHRIIGY